MKTRVFTGTLILLLILSACRIFSSVPGTTGSPAGSNKKYDYVFNASSNPLSLTVALDKGQSVEGLIPIQGGQLKTTGSDGTVYTLDIPDKALSGAAQISMTPVSSLSGLPFGGEQTYAVQLAPEGLVLYQNAILTITPPQPIAVDQQILFGYQGDGLAPILAVPVVNSQEIKIQLLHFSGYGVTEGPAADAAAAQLQLGSDPESRLESLTAQVVADERQRQESGAAKDEAFGKQILDLMDQYESQVVKPALEAAQSSCEAGKDAINQVINLERMRQLLGVKSENSLGPDLIALMSSAGKVCVQEEYQKCVDQHIIHTMIPLWLGLMREYELLGGAQSGPEPEEVKLAEELTVKCLTFELHFDSKGNFDAGVGGYNATVQSVIKLQLDPNDFTIRGEAPLDSLAFNFLPPAGCTATSTPGGGTFQVVTLEYITDTHSPTDKTGYVRDFKLVYFPGVSSESYHVNCPPKKPGDQESNYTSPPTGYWSGLFFTLHAEELNGAGASGTGISGSAGGAPTMPDISALLAGGDTGALPAFPAPTVPEGSGFLADTWQVKAAELMATKEWIKDNGAAGITENGTLKLYHRPGG